MNTYQTEPVASVRPEPNAKTLTPADLRKRLMATAMTIKETKLAKSEVSTWPASETKLWIIEALDNRVVGLMEHAEFTARALANAPNEVVT